MNAWEKTMDTSGAKGALTGDRYRESLSVGREVRLRRVTAAVWPPC
jgi:hypothetical protein